MTSAQLCIPCPQSGLTGAPISGAGGGAPEPVCGTGDPDPGPEEARGSCVLGGASAPLLRD